MKWIGSRKSSPLYIWEGDCWLNETDKKIYISDVEKRIWIDPEKAICDPSMSCKRIWVDKEKTKEMFPV